MAEEKFREPVASAQQIGANVLATAQQIAGGFFLLGGNVNRGQRARAIEHGELPGIATISLDAIARTPGNERGRDDVTPDVVRRQRTLQLEATRARFVTAADGSLAAEAFDEPEDRRTIGCQRMQRRRALARQQHGGDCRGRVLIECNDGSRLRHDRPPLYAALR
jgi:hypothetical protein